MRVSQILGKKRIDLNVDIGEGFPDDRELLSFASSANICCGVHAGSQELSLQTVDLCRRQRIRIGVHPGYPDRENMGRVTMRTGQERAYLTSIFSQTAWFVNAVRPEYLKPHGAFYSDTAMVFPAGWQTQLRKTETTSEYETAGFYLAQYPGMQSLLMLLRINRLPLLGLGQTSHRTICERARQSMICEGFADRKYRPDGTLLNRSNPGAVLNQAEDIVEQVLNLAPVVDSICLHGDTPDCLLFAERVYRTLVDAGYGVGY